MGDGRPLAGNLSPLLSWKGEGLESAAGRATRHPHTPHTPLVGRLGAPHHHPGWGAALGLVPGKQIPLPAPHGVSCRRLLTLSLTCTQSAVFKGPAPGWGWGGGSSRGWKEGDSFQPGQSPPPGAPPAPSVSRGRGRSLPTGPPAGAQTSLLRKHHPHPAGARPTSPLPGVSFPDTHPRTHRPGCAGQRGGSWGGMADLPIPTLRRGQVGPPH